MRSIRPRASPLRPRSRFSRFSRGRRKATSRAASTGHPRCYHGIRPVPLCRRRALGASRATPDSRESRRCVVGGAGRRCRRRNLILPRRIRSPGPRARPPPNERLPRRARREAREARGHGVRARGLPGSCARPLRGRLPDRWSRVLRVLPSVGRHPRLARRPPDVLYGHAGPSRGAGSALRRSPRPRGSSRPAVHWRLAATPRLSVRRRRLGRRPDRVPAAGVVLGPLRGPGPCDRGAARRVDVARLRSLDGGRGVLAPRPPLAALHPIVGQRMFYRHADAVRARADAVRLHRRAFRWRVLCRARRAGDVFDLVLRDVGGEVRHVPEDPEDLLVAQADVMEERDDREAAHVRHVFVVLDLREEVVHARREAGDAHLADVFRFEGRFLCHEHPADLRKVAAERRLDVVVDRKREALLDVPLDRVPHDPQRLLPPEDDVAALDGLVDELPRRVAHRVREAQEVREVESESTVLPAEVHAHLRGEVDDEVVRLGSEAALCRNRLAEREPTDEVRILQGRDEDSRDGVREEARELVRRCDRDPIGSRPLLEGVEDARLAQTPGSGVRRLEEDLLEAHLLPEDESGGFPEERILREAGELHGLRNAGRHKSPWRGRAKVRRPHTVSRAPGRSEGGSLVLSVFRRLRSFRRLQCPRRRRRDPELLHQGGHVPLALMLDALSLVEPRDIDPGDRHRLPRRGDAHEVALVRPGHRGPDGDLVAFGDDVVDRRLAVGERRAQHREPMLLALPARRHPWRRRVVHVILGGHLVDHIEIPAVQHFVVKHLHCRLVLLHAHCNPSVGLLGASRASGVYNRAPPARNGPKVFPCPVDGPLVDELRGYFAVHSQGLGHATRAVALARGLLERRPDVYPLFLAGSPALDLLVSSGFDALTMPPAPDWRASDGVLGPAWRWYVDYARYLRIARRFLRREADWGYYRFVISDSELAAAHEAVRRGIPTALILDALRHDFARDPLSRVVEGGGNLWLARFARKVDVILTAEPGPAWPNVRRVGPIVRPFSAPRERLRDDFFFRTKTILVTGGGTAIGEFVIRAAMEAFRVINLDDVSMVVVSGPKLKVDPAPGVYTYGFLPNLHDYVLAADLVIT